MATPGAGDWDFVMIDFSESPKSPGPIPEQRTGEADATAPAEGGAADGAQAAAPAAPARVGRKRRTAAPEQRPPRPGLLTGRRPSPLLLLASGTLVGGAVTGLVLVMLAGWGLGYLSRQLTDFMRKFAVLGIPLVTMSATTLWFWGRADGRWGEALAPGEQVGAAAWAAAPGVLRLSAVLSAVFLLAVAMKRRGGATG